MRTPLAIILAATAPAGGSAALFTLDMEGPPVQSPGTQYAIGQYFEDGFHLRPKGPIATTPPYHLARNGGGITFYPQNGGAFLQLLISDSLVVSKVDGGEFDALRVDLAEYSTVFPVPIAIGFRGFHADNSFVDVLFTTDGIIDGTGSLTDFQTFTFPSSFSNLVRIESLTDKYSLDNLVVSVPPPVPEPTAIFLALTSGSLLLTRRMRR